ncbi:hypothetical protein SmJEL517_g05071 [Synchytrium microbalum]|uniref:F-box domain-containing protein n=1 Tax=Synchytrium microbalum TaxID=1806994 RepID=A0A507C0Z0_9FUNG|nr:uncharacterized protein SmJEL517_g05071 [Synchytrium microbalum]TPX31646.1 hypothetical protein SmJEL517_g05071 [Synchytrium microbalum]
MAPKKPTNPPSKPSPPKTLTSLPPDLIVRIFTYVPVPDLAKVARTSRRLKIIAYADGVYEPKLRYLGIPAPANSDENLHASETDSHISVKLKQLPGGHMLASGAAYLETGTLWGGFDPTPPGSGRNSVGGVNPMAPGVAVQDVEPSLISQDTLDPFAPQTQPNIYQQLNSNGMLAPPKKSTLTIGAGGLRGAVVSGSVSNSSIGIASTRSPSGKVVRQSSGLPQRAARDAFKRIYAELSPYYVDFRKRGKDSRVFRDFKDLIEIATVLRRLKLFGNAKFITDYEDINFALDTTMEWFESMILAQFDRAYDKEDIEEMRRNAVAAYQLNGGAACVQLFISKNPIFFDHTFNPSLVATKLPPPTSSDDHRGYALADDFAKFMDHMLTNCRKQATIVFQVFLPDMHAMTLFVNKVFEDSIAEYLSAVLEAARTGGDMTVYLHTLATAVYCCTQFLDFISSVPNVPVEADRVAVAITGVFRPYTDAYLMQELDHMQRVFAAELSKFNKRKRNSGEVLNTPPQQRKNRRFQGDEREKHKRQVLSTVRTVLFAPIALGKTLTLTGNNRVKPQEQGLLGDDDEISSPIEDTMKLPFSSKEAATYDLDDDSLNALISLELCLNLMHTNKEALGRCLVITNACMKDKMIKNVEKIFCSLIDIVSEKHLRPALDNAVSRLGMPLGSTGDLAAPVEDNMDSIQFFELIHIADLVQQMIDVYYQEDVKPWIDESDFLSDVAVDKKTFERLLDDKVAQGMDKAIQILVAQVEAILVGEQKPKDFNPTDKAAVIDVKETVACGKVLACLVTNLKQLSAVTDKNTLEVFYGEIGIRLFNVLIKNIKRQQISQTGAMQLIFDLNKYYSWASSLHVPHVTKLFVVLKEVGNLFLAEGGQDLKTLIHDQHVYGSALKIEEIYELLQSRTDYKKIQKYVESKECCIQ